MAERVETDPRQAMQIAGVIVTATLILNLGFYFLSSMYFEDRAAMHGMATDAQINAVRYAFAAFTAIVAITAIAAVREPRLVGHGLAAMMGLVAIAGAFGAIKQDQHVVMPATLLVIGVLLPLLAWRSLERSRGAWAFLIAMCVTLASVTLFGSTKIRGALDLGLWHALILPGLLVVATVGLTMIRDEYREPERA